MHLCDPLSALMRHVTQRFLPGLIKISTSATTTAGFCFDQNGTFMILEQLARLFIVVRV